jgi:hypothetical protein
MLMSFESENSVINALLNGLERPNWKLSGERNGVLVFSLKLPESGYIGYKTISEYSTDIDSMTAFLGNGITTAMSMMNHRYLEGSITDESGIRIVRTAFSMPPGIRNRDFLHSLYLKRTDNRTSLIVYGPVSSNPEHRKVAGFVRCPIFPSGQRITWRGKNRVRVEHLMVYGLAGLIPAAIQNVLFHRGHIEAYLSEWGRLKQLVENPEWNIGKEKVVV